MYNGSGQYEQFKEDPGTCIGDAGVNEARACVLTHRSGSAMEKGESRSSQASGLEQLRSQGLLNWSKTTPSLYSWSFPTPLGSALFSLPFHSIRFFNLKDSQGSVMAGRAMDSLFHCPGMSRFLRQAPELQTHTARPQAR